MGEFILNGRNYGGSIITPNPSDTPTDTLDSIKIDDTTYEIQGGGGGSSLIIDAQRYSLEEKVVGIWTDGKPLYQKTFYFTTPVQVQANRYETLVTSSGLSIETIVSGEALPSKEATFTPISLTYTQSGDIQGYFPTAWSISYLTVRYTKTTDIAGSGGYQAYGFSPIIYSDVEREVGVWRDNKPLYQRTWQIALTMNTPNQWFSTGIGVTANHIDKVIGIVQAVSDEGTVWDNIGLATNADDVVRLISSRNTGGIQIEYITLLYTKTTDVAGSGEYNTLAIPNVHYSTDEQVIGTWIDGSTLYQKTKVISFSELTHQGNLYYKQFRETGENVVDVKAKAVSTSYGMCYLGCKNYTMNNKESYWELIMYYNNICLKFTDTTATDTNVSTITVTYQYTKTTD